MACKDYDITLFFVLGSATSILFLPRLMVNLETPISFDQGLQRG